MRAARGPQPGVVHGWCTEAQVVYAQAGVFLARELDGVREAQRERMCLATDAAARISSHWYGFYLERKWLHVLRLCATTSPPLALLFSVLFGMCSSQFNTVQICPPYYYLNNLF